MKIKAIIILFFLSTVILSSSNLDSSDLKYRYIKLLNIPQYQKGKHKIVKVAVVDMGFRLSHKAINDFIFTNENEIPNNYRDDDKNGFVDDINGWDFADKDNNVSVPEHRKKDLYHGTFISGIITKIFSEYFGDQAKNYLKIIPVKVYADNSKRGEILHGYEGIRYAADMGADIICCAWSGGKLRYEDKVHLDYAISKGSLIISTAGNFNTEETYPPADYVGVFGIAAVDYSLIKTKKSNFSKMYKLSCYGESIYGPHSDADNAYFFDSGTSPAVAMISACSAILKTISPKSTPEEIMTALINTAAPIDSINGTYAGKLGAGVPDMTKAIEFIINNKYKSTYFNSTLPSGKILFKKNVSPLKYTIHPIGEFKGIHVIPNSFDKKGKILVTDLLDSLIYSGSIYGIKRGLFIKGNGAKIQIDKKNSPNNFDFSYYMETIDSTKLYCSGVNYLAEDNGAINDGSGIHNYANNSVCKWIITAPRNHRIKIDFKSIDTETDVDYVWIFEGNSTREEDILAKFSGKILPPSITSFTNEILIWFLTDEKNTGKGWELKYCFVD